MLTLAFLLTIWSSSGAMVSIITTLNAAYDVTEGRPFWWKMRLTAIALTVGLAVFVLVSMLLMLVGPDVRREQVAISMHLGTAFKWTWWVLQWPVVFALVVTGVGARLLFRARRRAGLGLDHAGLDPRDACCGSSCRSVSRPTTQLLRQLQRRPTARSARFIVVLIVVLPVGRCRFCVGAELNAEIEHASPYGKAPGEKVPGEKKMIGPMAQRDYEERKAKGEIPIRPFPDDVNCDLDGKPPRGDDGDARERSDHRRRGTAARGRQARQEATTQDAG